MKWNVVSARVKLRPNVMGEHEHRSVERRHVAPPSVPVVVLPGPALGTELVASHDLGTDVVREVASEVVVEAARSTRVGAVRPAGSRSGPCHQLCRVGVAEGSFESLTLA